MIGIGYFRAEPTEYARISAKGKVSKEGKGISSFYLSQRDSIELVRTTTIDQPVSFPEVTADKQQVTLQGGFLYRVKEPDKVLSQYDFAIDPKTKSYRTEDPAKIPEHILEVTRTHARQIVQKTKLEDLLVMSDELSNKVFEKMKESPVTAELGIEVSMLYFSSIQPQPEIAKALGATYREDLLQKADKATYERRAKAVEQERAIKENELKNSIELEDRRKVLVRLEGENTMARAGYEADAAKLAMEVYSSMDAETIRAHALNQLARNAQKIETLTITPELLAGLRRAA